MSQNVYGAGDLNSLWSLHSTKEIEKAAHLNIRSVLSDVKNVTFIELIHETSRNTLFVVIPALFLHYLCICLLQFNNPTWSSIESTANPRIMVTECLSRFALHLDGNRWAACTRTRRPIICTCCDMSECLLSNSSVVPTIITFYTSRFPVRYIRGRPPRLEYGIP